MIIKLFLLFQVSLLNAQTTLPGVNLSLANLNKPEDVVSGVKILLLLTILTLAPSILMMMTSFTRIVIVLSFIRTAIGTQQLPPNQIIVGLSLFLTFFVMTPTFTKINDNALQPYLNETISREQAMSEAEKPLRDFMFAQVSQKDLELFYAMSKKTKPKSLDEVSTMVLVPAFMISELKIAFQIGFLIFIPFLILDLVVSSVLMAMGMMMLPPVVVSMPFKLMLFVLVDGWGLIITSLVKSFNA